MNRKVAVAAIVGGLMHTMSLLRAQEVQPVPTRICADLGPPAKVSRPFHAMTAEPMMSKPSERCLPASGEGQVAAPANEAFRRRLASTMLCPKFITTGQDRRAGACNADVALVPQLENSYSHPDDRGGEPYRVQDIVGSGRS